VFTHLALPLPSSLACSFWVTSSSVCEELPFQILLGRSHTIEHGTREKQKKLVSVQVDSAGKKERGS